MPSSMTFTDRYSDDLEIIIYENVVDFDATVGGQNVALEFTREEARQIADFIIGEDEPEVAQAKAPVAVDPVTLFSGETGNERFEWNRVASITAQKLGLPLSFRYTKSDKAPVEIRTLTQVTDVLQSSEGHYIVIGHSDERDDARSFRIDRMVSYAWIAK